MSSGRLTRLPVRETDCEFLLRVLSDGGEHCLTEIQMRSLAERGHPLTVHSRAADLRRQGHAVVNWMDTSRGERGRASWYRLEAPFKETPAGVLRQDDPPAAADSSGDRGSAAGTVVTDRPVVAAQLTIEEAA